MMRQLLLAIVGTVTVLFGGCEVCEECKAVNPYEEIQGIVESAIEAANPLYLFRIVNKDESPYFSVFNDHEYDAVTLEVGDDHLEIYHEFHVAANSWLDERIFLPYSLIDSIVVESVSCSTPLFDMYIYLNGDYDYLRVPQK
jgi:hypothetical protein